MSRKEAEPNKLIHSVRCEIRLLLTTPLCWGEEDLMASNFTADSLDELQGKLAAWIERLKTLK